MSTKKWKMGRTCDCPGCSKMKKLRVCSAHFSDDDYVSCPGKKEKQDLKRSAVPAPQVNAKRLYQRVCSLPHRAGAVVTLCDADVGWRAKVLMNGKVLRLWHDYIPFVAAVAYHLCLHYFKQVHHHVSVTRGLAAAAVASTSTLSNVSLSPARSLSARSISFWRISASVYSGS